MLPGRLQCSRGLTAAEISVSNGRVAEDSQRFNAAAASRPRKLVLLVIVLLMARSPASMQPRPHGRGNTCRTCSQAPAHHHASMQPRPHGRGNYLAHSNVVNGLTVLQCSRGLTAAEMGRRGSKACLANPLQCSRGLTAAEMEGRLSLARTSRQLQCSRGLTAAEIATQARCPGRGDASFNAAAASRPRKFPGARPIAGKHAASMQPRPHGRGNMAI